MSKSGFSTLNRWLGRKNKEKSMSNGKLSKSSTNLSISTTNINETSQLEYNRITPLPAATTNAPFEQTFRITVLLPKDQLYVARLGARVPLSKLLELVCDNKLLDPQKYEFRNPVDASQVYSCDLTIGAVGLSEIRLCHKSESYDNFNTDEIMKLQRTTIIRESLTSSEFSGRNSKHTTKTTSPYSSTNSLNSMDSSGIHSTKATRSAQPKIAAPPRKKRVAPKPPSQAAIPEKSALITQKTQQNGTLQSPEGEQKSLTTKDFSVSTPNLSSTSNTLTTAHSDINGNDCNGHLAEEEEEQVSSKNLTNGYTEDTVLYAQVQKKNALNLNNLNGSSVANSPSHSPSPATPEIGDHNKFPEPSPRKKVVPVPQKKKTAAPAAPLNRGSMYNDDTESIASSNVASEPSTPVTYTAPKPAERAMSREDLSNDMPKPQPRITTSTTMLNTPEEEVITTKQRTTGNNVSKVMLNRTPTPEPRSLSCEPPDMDVCYETQLENLKRPIEEDNVSKQADSGIGEPVPSPIPDCLPSEVCHLDVKSNFESSSDDDDMVKVYNFKLGKTLVKPLNETKTLEELTLMNAGQEETDSELQTPLTQVPCSATPSETSSWNFSIPISPPPNFADGKFGDAFEKEKQQEQENPITPKIVERPVLNFEVLKQEEAEKKPKVVEKSPTTPLDNILGELSAIIQDKGLDTLIKKSEESAEIEAAKPNTLTNFSITSGAQSNLTKPKEVQCEEKTQKVVEETEKPKTTSPPESPINAPDEEKLYRKRNSVTSLKQRRSINRSDSFHTTAIATENSSNLNRRTSSQMSLDQISGNLNRRRSSSELSIGESPSLQSLEVMKTILNSRKNSLAQSASEEEEPIEVNTRRPSEELKFTSLELKTKTSGENKIQEQENDKKLWETTNKESESSKASEELAEKKQLPKEASVENVETKPKELPKVYRYSGPPSINFSTWSERPKAQVAIKNEGDYIFGGKMSRQSTPAGLYEDQLNLQTPPVAPKPDTIQRMGIPEKDYEVPILVKPLPDVIIDKTVVQAKLKAVQTQKAESPINEKPTKPPTPVKNIPNGSLKLNLQRPTVESVLKPQTQTIVSTATLPRNNNNKRFNTPSPSSSTATTPITPGPQLLRSTSTKRDDRNTKSMVVVSENKATTPITPGPQLLRSTSTKREERETKSMVITNETVAAAPFGQNTLRRTGFKEKMLAQEEEEKQKISSNQPSKAYTNGGEIKVTSTTTTLSSSAKPPTSAKLHLNLQKSTSITITNGGGSSSATITPVTPTLRPKPQTPKTAPVTSTTTPPPAVANKPPIPPPMLMSVNLKPVTAVRSPLPAGHPRDQLMDAIKNFKREQLKKA
ncbi:uncharacterized protein [Musca autumnalis]|uniref:uncharacterized protein n=1 Tax=Musca autumnalis TaxID=221902 RepID=UPI003CEDC77B